MTRRFYKVHLWVSSVACYAWVASSKLVLAHFVESRFVLLRCSHRFAPQPQKIGIANDITFMMSFMEQARFRSAWIPQRYPGPLIVSRCFSS